jgi:hypothetical protein
MSEKSNNREEKWIKVEAEIVGASQEISQEERKNQRIGYLEQTLGIKPLPEVEGVAKMQEQDTQKLITWQEVIEIRDGHFAKSEAFYNEAERLQYFTNLGLINRGVPAFVEQIKYHIQQQLAISRGEEAKPFPPGKYFRDVITDDIIKRAQTELLEIAQKHNVRNEPPRVEANTQEEIKEAEEPKSLSFGFEIQTNNGLQPIELPFTETIYLEPNNTNVKSFSFDLAPIHKIIKQNKAETDSQDNTPKTLDTEPSSDNSNFDFEPQPEKPKTTEQPSNNDFFAKVLEKFRGIFGDNSDSNSDNTDYYDDQSSETSTNSNLPSINQKTSIPEQKQVKNSNEASTNPDPIEVVASGISQVYILQGWVMKGQEYLQAELSKDQDRINQIQREASQTIQKVEKDNPNDNNAIIERTKNIVDQAKKQVEDIQNKNNSLISDYQNFVDSILKQVEETEQKVNQSIQGNTVINEIYQPYLDFVGVTKGEIQETNTLTQEQIQTHQNQTNITKGVVEMSSFDIDNLVNRDKENNSSAEQSLANLSNFAQNLAGSCEASQSFLEKLQNQVGSINASEINNEQNLVETLESFEEIRNTALSSKEELEDKITALRNLQKICNEAINKRDNISEEIKQELLKIGKDTQNQIANLQNSLQEVEQTIESTQTNLQQKIDSIGSNLNLSDELANKVREILETNLNTNISDDKQSDQSPSSPLQAFVPTNESNPKVDSTNDSTNTTIAGEAFNVFNLIDPKSIVPGSIVSLLFAVLSPNVNQMPKNMARTNNVVRGVEKNIKDLGKLSDRQSTLESKAQVISQTKEQKEAEKFNIMIELISRQVLSSISIGVGSAGLMGLGFLFANTLKDDRNKEVLQTLIASQLQSIKSKINSTEFESLSYEDLKNLIDQNVRDEFNKLNTPEIDRIKELFEKNNGIVDIRTLDKELDYIISNICKNHPDNSAKALTLLSGVVTSSALLFTFNQPNIQDLNYQKDIVSAQIERIVEAKVVNAKELTQVTKQLETEKKLIEQQLDKLTSKLDLNLPYNAYKRIQLEKQLEKINANKAKLQEHLKLHPIDPKIAGLTELEKLKNKSKTSTNWDYLSIFVATWLLGKGYMMFKKHQNKKEIKKILDSINHEGEVKLDSENINSIVEQILFEYGEGGNLDVSNGEILIENGVNNSLINSIAPLLKLQGLSLNNLESKNPNNGLNLQTRFYQDETDGTIKKMTVKNSNSQERSKSIARFNIEQALIDNLQSYVASLNKKYKGVESIFENGIFIITATDDYTLAEFLKEINKVTSKLPRSKLSDKQGVNTVEISKQKIISASVKKIKELCENPTTENIIEISKILLSSQVDGNFDSVVNQSIVYFTPHTIDLLNSTFDLQRFMNSFGNNNPPPRPPNNTRTGGENNNENNPNESDAETDSSGGNNNNPPPPRTPTVNEEPPEDEEENNPNEGHFFKLPSKFRQIYNSINPKNLNITPEEISENIRTIELEFERILRSNGFYNLIVQDFIPSKNELFVLASQYLITIKSNPFEDNNEEILNSNEFREFEKSLKTTKFFYELIARHPNTSMIDLVNLSNNFMEDVLINPSFEGYKDSIYIDSLSPEAIEAIRNLGTNYGNFGQKIMDKMNKDDWSSNKLPFSNQEITDYLISKASASDMDRVIQIMNSSKFRLDEYQLTEILLQMNSIFNIHKTREEEANISKDIKNIKLVFKSRQFDQEMSDKLLFSNQDAIKQLVIKNSPYFTKDKLDTYLNYSITLLPKEDLGENMSDSQFDVIEIINSIAKSKHASPEMLQKIIDIDNPNKRFISFDIIAKNPNVTPEILRQLANINTHENLLNICANPKTPPNVLEDIRHNAINQIDNFEYNPANPNEYPELEDIIIAICKNPATPLPTVMDIYNSYPNFRAYLISNPNIPADVIAQNLDNPTAVQLNYLSFNPNLDTSTLNTLLQKSKNDEGEDIIQNIDFFKNLAKAKNADEKLLLALLQRENADLNKIITGRKDLSSNVTRYIIENNPTWIPALIYKESLQPDDYTTAIESFLPLLTNTNEYKKFFDILIKNPIIPVENIEQIARLIDNIPFESVTNGIKNQFHFKNRYEKERYQKQLRNKIKKANNDDNESQPPNSSSNPRPNPNPNEGGSGNSVSENSNTNNSNTEANTNDNSGNNNNLPPPKPPNNTTTGGESSDENNPNQGFVEDIIQSQTSEQIDQIWNNLSLEQRQDELILNAIANNENTSSETLSQLLETNPEIRQIIASNPNTNLEDLYRLVKEYPEEVLNNSVIPLYLLDNFDVYSNLLGEIVSERREILDTFFGTLSNILSNNSNSIEIQQSTSNIILNMDIEKKLKLIRNPFASTEILEILSNDTNATVLTAVANYELVTEEILIKLSSSSNIDVMMAVAKNSKTPVDKLQQLFSINDNNINQSLAGNPSTPAHILENIDYLDDITIGSALAGNPNTPIHILEILSEPGNYNREIASLLAGIRGLNTLNDEAIYEKLAKNPSTPVDILNKLADNNNPKISGFASKNLESRSSNDNNQITLYTLEDIEEALLDAVSEEELTNIWNSLSDEQRQDEDIRLSFTNEDTPEHILQILATNPNELSGSMAQDILDQREISDRDDDEDDNPPSNPNPRPNPNPNEGGSGNTIIEENNTNNPSTDNSSGNNNSLNTPRSFAGGEGGNEGETSFLDIIQNNTIPKELTNLWNILSEYQKKDVSILEAFSRNPVTETTVLHDILEQNPKLEDINKIIAGHPATSHDDLIKLSKKHFREVLEGEFFSLIALENTSIVDQIINQIAGDRTGILAREELSISSALQSPIIIIREETMRKLANNIDTPKSVLTVLSKKGNDFVKSQVAKNFNTSSETLEELATDEDMNVRNNVANNLNTSSKTLEKLAGDSEGRIRCTVADNPNTTPEILGSLAKEKSIVVRYNVAKNNNTSTIILSSLASDQHVDTRCRVADNPNTSSDTLTRLAKDEQSAVRYSVGINNNTLIETLTDLANDEDIHVRYNVANNLNTSSKTLEKLAGDSECRIRCTVADNPNTTPEILEKLAGDENEYVRIRVARNINTPVKTLKKLSNDSDEVVKYNANDNANMS